MDRFNPAIESDYLYFVTHFLLQYMLRPSINRSPNAKYTTLVAPLLIYIQPVAPQCCQSGRGTAAGHGLGSGHRRKNENVEWNVFFASPTLCRRLLLVDLSRSVYRSYLCRLRKRKLPPRLPASIHVPSRDILPSSTLRASAPAVCVFCASWSSFHRVCYFRARLSQKHLPLH